MMTHTVLPATADDAVAIARLIPPATASGWTAASLASGLTEGRYRGWIFHANHQPAGFALLQVAEDESELLLIVTHPEWRNRGWGLRLMAEIVAFAWTAKLAAITLEVAASNDAAQRMYRRFGFRQVGARPRYYASNEDALLFRIDVDAR